MGTTVVGRRITSANRSKKAGTEPCWGTTNSGDTLRVGIAHADASQGLFEYIDRGMDDDLSCRRTRVALDNLTVVPRVLAGFEQVDLSSHLFGRSVSFPAVMAPTALAGMVCRDGELEAARLAAVSGIPYCLSTQSISPLEEVQAAVPEVNLWFQLYLWNSWELSTALMARAAKAGIDVLVVTVDTPVSPYRDYNEQNGFTVPFRPTVTGVTDLLSHPGWLARVLLPMVIKSGLPSYGHYPQKLRGNIFQKMDPSVGLCHSMDWGVIRRVRELWKGHSILKGIMNAEDAYQAWQVGADGIVGSAHGGRNVDSFPPLWTCCPILLTG